MSDRLDLEVIRRGTNALALALPEVVYADYAPRVFTLCDEVERLRLQDRGHQAVASRCIGELEQARQDVLKLRHELELVIAFGYDPPMVTELVEATAHYEHHRQEGGEMKTLPFRSHFREAIETGRKTCTARTRRYGEPGETLDTIAGPILLTAVHKLPLAVVRDHYWWKEGCDSPEHFEQVWNEIHPRKGFDPEQMVWLHTFKVSSRWPYAIGAQEGEA